MNSCPVTLAQPYSTTLFMELGECLPGSNFISFTSLIYKRTGYLDTLFPDRGYESDVSEYRVP